MTNITPVINNTIFIWNLTSKQKAEYAIAIPIIPKNISSNFNKIVLISGLFKYIPSWKSTLFYYSVSLPPLFADAQPIQVLPVFRLKALPWLSLSTSIPFSTDQVMSVIVPIVASFPVPPANL